MGFREAIPTSHGYTPPRKERFTFAVARQQALCPGPCVQPFQQPPYPGADCRQELGQCGRFRGVAIGAEPNRQFPVRLRLRGSEDQHRNPVQCLQRAHVLQDFEAGDFRKVQIDDDDVWQGCFREWREHTQGLLAVVTTLHPGIDALLAQRFLHQEHVGIAIFDDKYRYWFAWICHRTPRPPGRGSRDNPILAWPLPPIWKWIDTPAPGIAN